MGCYWYEFGYFNKKGGMKNLFHPLLYRNRKTIGQFIIIPTEPYCPPPRPLIHSSSAKPKMANSSVSRDRYPLSIAS